MDHVPQIETIDTIGKNKCSCYINIETPVKNQASLDDYNYDDNGKVFISYSDNFVRL